MTVAKRRQMLNRNKARTNFKLNLRPKNTKSISKKYLFQWGPFFRHRFPTCRDLNFEKYSENIITITMVFDPNSVSAIEKNWRHDSNNWTQSDYIVIFVSFIFCNSQKKISFLPAQNTYCPHHKSLYTICFLFSARLVIFHRWAFCKQLRPPDACVQRSYREGLECLLKIQIFFLAVMQVPRSFLPTGMQKNEENAWYPSNHPVNE